MINLDQKLKSSKTDKEVMQDRLLKKYKDFILAITKENNRYLVLANAKKAKEQNILEELVKTIKQIDLSIDFISVKDLVQECDDSKSMLLDKMKISEIVYSNGIIQGLILADKHKDLVLNKLENYVMSYVLAGSIIKGFANEKSDIDIYIIVDDTDVKRMTRVELIDRLRSITYQLSHEAAKITGLKNRLHPQLYLLTDYWEWLKDASPVITTLLRDCIPLYDKGTFVPWKNLLKMGRIKASKESIEKYLEFGTTSYTKIKNQLKSLAMEELCLGLIYPTQALFMKEGIDVPGLKETPEYAKKYFVDEKDYLTKDDVKLLSDAINIRKSIEYQDINEIDLSIIDLILKKGDKYIEKVKSIIV